MKCGVIIIGSLLWDNSIRNKWRNCHLDKSRQFQVYLPIRYGRLSTTRHNTYTMVFSYKCYSYGLGKGWFFPIKKEINNFEELKNEAFAMAKAEGINSGLVNSWGIIGLLVNPLKKKNIDIINNWKQFMRNKLKNHKIFTTKLKSQKAIINSDGILNLRWPKVVDEKNDIKDFDLLLITITKPTLTNNRYPLVAKISRAMLDNNYKEYFSQNRKNDITTFQDERIEKYLKNKLFCRKAP